MFLFIKKTGKDKEVLNSLDKIIEVMNCYNELFSAYWVFFLLLTNILMYFNSHVQI